MTTGRILKLLACAAVLSASSAFAQSTSSTFRVSATVVRACVVSATDVPLPNYDSTAGTPSDGPGTISVTCTRNLGYHITLSSTGNAWQLRSASGDTLDYRIYSDAYGGTLWNETTQVNGTGGGHTPIDHTAYVRVAANQDAPEGTYQDTVTVNVTF